MGCSWGCCRDSAPQHTPRDSKVKFVSIWQIIEGRLYGCKNRLMLPILRPRMYSGREPFAEFLRRELRIQPGTMNMEIISPYFENDVSAITLGA
jgi:hypothetical protein